VPSATEVPLIRVTKRERTTIFVNVWSVPDREGVAESGVESDRSAEIEAADCFSSSTAIGTAMRLSQLIALT